MKRLRTIPSSILVTALLFGGFSSLIKAEQAVPRAHAEAANGLIVYLNAPDSVTPGGKLQFSITVRNASNQTITDVKLSDPINQFTNQLTFLPNESGARNDGDVRCAKNGTDPVWCLLSNDHGITLSPGAVEIYTLTFQVADGAPCGSIISNAADIHVGGSQNAFTNWTNTTRTILDCSNNQVDLSMMKTGPSTVIQGQTVLYSIWAVHVSGPTATNIVVRDPIPSGLVFSPAHSSPACRQEGPNIECTAGSLSHTEDKRGFDVAFTVPTTTPCNSSISNIATVTASQPDPHTSNNTQNPAVLTTVTCPQSTTDLSITKSGPSSVYAGQNVTYVLTVRNNGSAAAQNVAITDTFPSPLAFDHHSRDALCAVSGNTVTCQNFSLNAGEARTFTLNFTTSSVSGSCFSQTISNTASVTSSTLDTNTSNNTSGTVTTSLGCPVVTPAFTIQVTDNRTIAAPGDTITYAIVIRNASSTHASNVAVTSLLPSQVSFLSASDGGSLNGQLVHWQNLLINANSEKILTLDARVSPTISSATVITNTATVNGGASASDSTAVIPNAASTGTQSAFNQSAQTSTELSDATTNTTVIGNENDVTVTTVQTHQNFQIQTVDQEIEQIRHLPVTGIEQLAYAAPLENTRAHLTRAKKPIPKPFSASLPHGIWSILSVAGLGLGAVFGRKYFV